METYTVLAPYTTDIIDAHWTLIKRTFTIAKNGRQKMHLFTRLPINRSDVVEVRSIKGYFWFPFLIRNGKIRRKETHSPN